MNKNTVFFYSLNCSHIGESWPELLQSLFAASQSSNSGQRETAFKVFAITPGIIEKQHEETVMGAFTKAFKDDDVNVSSN